jgi:hypothetical protein
MTVGPVAMVRVIRCTQKYGSQCSLTIVWHPHGKTLLKPTVLTFISALFVDPTVKIAPIINEFQSDGPPEEALPKGYKNHEATFKSWWHRETQPTGLKGTVYQKRWVLGTVLPRGTSHKSLTLSTQRTRGSPGFLLSSETLTASVDVIPCTLVLCLAFSKL